MVGSESAFLPRTQTGITVLPIAADCGLLLLEITDMSVNFVSNENECQDP
jgi:hypothetical protein